MAFNFPFTSRAMTQEVRKYPKRYGLISAMNIFPLEPITSTFVQVTNENGVLTVVPAAERGAPGSKTKRSRQDMKIFQVPHFPVEDQILASDLQDRKIVVGGQEVAANLPGELAKREHEAARRHAITAEYVRMSAMKGIVKDGDGTTLTNLFTDFGVTQKAIDFVLGTAGTDVRAKDEELRAHIEDNVLGESVTGVECFVSSEFFGKLIDHAKIKALYESSPDVKDLREFYRLKTGGISGRVFNPFGGVTYIEYRGSAPLTTGSERFIAANEGHAIPSGTMNLFSTFAAPADTLDEVNDIPSVTDMDLEDGVEQFVLPIFMSAELMKHGKGVELWSEMNILPITKQPYGALVKVLTSN